MHDEDMISTVGELREALSLYPDHMGIQIGESELALILKEHVPGTGKIFDAADTESAEPVLVLMDTDMAETMDLEQDADLLDPDRSLYERDDEEDDEEDDTASYRRGNRRRWHSRAKSAE